jgi:hypothetical protein
MTQMTQIKKQLDWAESETCHPCSKFLSSCFSSEQLLHRLRLCRSPCGKAPPFRIAPGEFGGSAAEAKPQRPEAGDGKPEAFRKGGGEAAKSIGRMTKLHYKIFGCGSARRVTNRQVLVFSRKFFSDAMDLSLGKEIKPLRTLRSVRSTFASLTCR